MDFYNDVKKIVLTISIFIQMNNVYFLFLEITHFALRWFSFVDAKVYLTTGKGIESLVVEGPSILILCL